MQKLILPTEKVKLPHAYKKFKNIIVNVNTHCELTEFRLTALTAVPPVKPPSVFALGGCFPRAWPQPPRADHSAGSSDSCFSRWSHRPPLTQTGLSSMVRYQSEYEISVILGAVQIHRRLLREESLG